MKPIEIEDIRKAEQVLQVSGDLGGIRGAEARLNISEDTVNKYMSYCGELLKARLPDLDPRIEPSLNTVMRHCLLVGVQAGKASEK